MATLDLAGHGYYSGSTGTIAARGYIESRASVIRSLVVTYEAIRVTPLLQVNTAARARDIATSGYYGGVTTIIATGGFRTQQQRIVADFDLDLKAVKTLNSDHTALFDVLANVGLVMRSQDFYYDAHGAINSSASAPFDAVAAVQRQMPSAYDALSALSLDAAAQYEGNRLILAAATIPFETAGAWGVTVFLNAAGAVHFLTAPLRNSNSDVALRQSSSRDTSGSLYVYNKSINKNRSHTLELRAGKETLDALIYFHETATQGTKLPWTWFDQDNRQHTVKFIDKSIPWKRIGPDKYEITVHLREDSAL